MEVIIKAPRERGTDTEDFLEVRGPRTQDALQSSKVPQQSAPLGRTQSRNRLQDGFIVATGTPTAMAADRKAVCLVADSLNHPRSGRMRFK